MAKYYYFISSLPMLKMEEDPPFSYQEFLEKAKGLMKGKDYAEILSCSSSAEGEPHSTLMKKWKDYKVLVESTLVDQRARKLGLDDSRYKLKGKADGVLSDRIQKIVNELDPLQGEREVLSIYFDFLSSIPLQDPFSVETLMIYALKLELLERSRSFSQERGKNEFDRLFQKLGDDLSK